MRASGVRGGIDYNLHSMRRTLITLAAGMLVSVGANRVYAEAAPKTFELNDGRFTEVPTTNPADLPKADPALKRVESQIDRKQFSAAEKDSLNWLVSHRNDPNYDLGLYLHAQALNGNSDPIKAFYFCDQLLDTYPASPYFAQALELQFAIGDSLLSGRKLSFAGLGILDGSDDAIEMMFRIQQRSAGSPMAERALRRTADYYFSQGDFDLAADAYGAHAKTYPRNPNLPEILVRQAFSNYAQFTGVKFDPTPLINARAQMSDLIQRYPEVAQRENIASFVDSIDQTLARKLLVTADFYNRTNKPDAAKSTLQVLVNGYPQTDEAQRAKKMLGEG